MASASSGLKNDRGPILTAVSIMLIILPTIGVGLRLLARRISTAKLWYDDYFIMVALVGYSKELALKGGK